MKIFNALMLLLFFTSLTSCKTDKVNTKKAAITNTLEFTKKQELSTNSFLYYYKTPKIKPAFPKDGIQILSSNIEGNTLTLDCTFSGGCEPHDFHIYFNGMSAKSLPPKINIELYHDAHNDNCEAKISQTLKINLIDLLGESMVKQKPVIQLHAGTKQLQFIMK